MAGKRKKPAKMGHYRAKAEVETKPYSATFKEVIELINDDKEAIVVLDEKGTRAIIDAKWVTTDPHTGKLIPISLACPVVYDHNRREEAINRYKEYENATQSSV